MVQMFDDLNNTHNGYKLSTTKQFKQTKNVQVFIECKFQFQQLLFLHRLDSDLDKLVL